MLPFIFIAFIFIAPEIRFWLLQIIKPFSFPFVGRTLPTANPYVTKNKSMLNIDDYCLEVTPRDNSSFDRK